MAEQKRDKTKVDPLSDAEEATPSQSSVPGGPAKPEPGNVPPTGEVVKDITGQPAKRVVRT